MAAVVQSFPQQNGTVTMLQTRPSSSSGGAMPGHSHPHSQSGASQQYASNSQNQRNNGSYGLGGQTSYRGISATGPVQPYAFTSTPALGNPGQWQPYGALRTTSTPSLPTTQTLGTGSNTIARPQYQTHASMTNVPTTAKVAVQGMTRDDSALPSGTRQQGMSAGQPTFAQVASGKAAPERYRRAAPRVTVADSSSSSQSSTSGAGSAMPSGSGMATVVHLYNPRAIGQKMSLPRNSATLPSRPHSLYGYMPGMAADDMVIQRQPTEEELRRFRRRSMHSIDSSEFTNPLTPQEFKQQTEAALRGQKFNIPDKNTRTTRVVPVPASSLSPNNTAAAQARNGSSESLVSSRSSNSRPSSSANRNSNATASTTSPASAANTEEKPSSAPKLVTIPPRGSSSDAAKRVVNPSPLSKPATMASEEAVKPASGSAAMPPPSKAPGSSHGSAVPAATSPAAQHLAALNEKGAKSKSKSSRLRRAFSFGSAADFKKAADAAEGNKSGHNVSGRLQKEPDVDDLFEQEHARIAQKQEASGLGSQIYSGTKIFAGSTDNLSISSTASSASIMLRKMGKGMKKGGRSLVGLFRPKSLHGTSIGEVVAPEASQAAVSMITVEAERERVNVNSNADLTQQQGASGFPRLERNSMDAMDVVHTDSLKSDDSNARKSIVGGERERAEVLGAIRKARSNSPSPSPQTGKGPVFELPMIPNVSDSPYSSAPSTPGEDVSGHKTNGSVTIGNEDYFMSALKLRQDTKSAPGTPSAGLAKRNATFSPRIIFHDTWPPQEYDRRGEIATCNRLTPMLAQQIKEELNSFKMEMEVHETSKIYTHFF
ncbi:hypothetical protein BKA67DRAFT_269954 [Truncatella angustata]|uniref:Protein BNI4 n=1 Tax=Truncatella angustata TaxID=152316 RepID=A0A9P8UKZ3_9PEZI|nr:uncharacterized protein BKA67DRAFT_269954 [Truncatella angustata]KAH6654103.1 hypothetical protein BKA67DRAFT_269954 [Truncatella angustata]